MEYLIFIIAATVTIASSILALTRLNASHALIYLVVTLLSLAVIFFLLGAPFAAALQIVVYAGAIVVLFLFVVMMLNVGRSSVERERKWLQPRMWYGPAFLSGVLFAILCVTIYQSGVDHTAGNSVSPKQVGIALFGPYIIAVELAGILLLAGLVGAYHLGRTYLSDRRSS